MTVDLFIPSGRMYNLRNLNTMLNVLQPHRRSFNILFYKVISMLAREKAAWAWHAGPEPVFILHRVFI